MRETVFVVGGCRSGKSRHALELAEETPGKRKTFIATCIPRDGEMEERVANHKIERGPGWTTVEAPVRLPEAILENSKRSDVVVADCLTLWVSNLLLEGYGRDRLEEHTRKLTDSLEKASCSVIIVSNEVGTGIVPENKIARLFRDVVGNVNQAVARTAGRVVMTVAGLPVTIKKS